MNFFMVDFLKNGDIQRVTECFHQKFDKEIWTYKSKMRQTEGVIIITEAKTRYEAVLNAKVRFKEVIAAGNLSYYSLSAYGSRKDREEMEELEARRRIAAEKAENRRTALPVLSLQASI
jgi:hypothetical protein